MKFLKLVLLPIFLYGACLSSKKEQKNAFSEGRNWPGHKEILQDITGDSIPEQIWLSALSELDCGCITHGEIVVIAKSDGQDWDTCRLSLAKILPGSLQITAEGFISIKRAISGVGETGTMSNFYKYKDDSLYNVLWLGDYQAEYYPSAAVALTIKSEILSINKSEARLLFDYSIGLSSYAVYEKNMLMMGQDSEEEKYWYNEFQNLDSVINIYQDKDTVQYKFGESEQKYIPLDTTRIIKVLNLIKAENQDGNLQNLLKIELSEVEKNGDAYQKAAIRLWKNRKIFEQDIKVGEGQKMSTYTVNDSIRFQVLKYQDSIIWMKQYNFKTGELERIR